MGEAAIPDPKGFGNGRWYMIRMRSYEIIVSIIYIYTYIYIYICIYVCKYIYMHIYGITNVSIDNIYIYTIWLFNIANWKIVHL